VTPEEKDNPNRAITSEEIERVAHWGITPHLNRIDTNPLKHSQELEEGVLP
jgi:hypothetical protein